jgi:hypothetical protein
MRVNNYFNNITTIKNEAAPMQRNPAMKQTPVNGNLRLPFLFDTTLLGRDLSACLAEEWKQHFNQNDFAGTWNGIALRSVTGSAQDIYAHPVENAWHDTPLLARCPYFREVVDRFACEKETIRLLRLAPGSIIKEHRDRGLGYAFGVFRIHIPILTDTNVSFRVGGEELPMKSGECWYADFDLPHSVANESASERVHLVIDCIRNAWSDELFREAGYDFEAEKKKLEPDPETKRRIQEELLRMNTETSRKLAQQSGENKS